jgi:hypothetical protein
VTAALAAPAQAVVVQKHLVRFTSTGFDFGNADFVFGAPSGTGWLDWKYENGEVTPNATGTLHLDNVVGDCARMRMDYRDADDDPLATRFGGTVCAATNQHSEFTVDLEPYSSPLIQEVTVALEKQTTLNGPFTTVQASSMGVGINPDEPKITANGFDFGNSSWSFGAPDGNGSMLWSVEDDGAIRPNLGGTLHLQQRLRRVRADEPALPRDRRHVHHLARRWRGVRERQRPPRVHRRPRPVRLARHRQGERPAAVAERERDVQRPRVRDRVDRVVAGG